jgi:hypothetical protein
MKEFKLFNTDGKTFFDFRSDPESRCEAFTVSYLDDGTVVMSGDYGTLCWKRNYHHAGKEEFNRDYGFPNKETGIDYFEEKVCQFGVEQKIREFNKEKAVELFEERYKQYKDDEKEKYEQALEEMRWIEEFDEVKFYEIVREFDSDFWEYKWQSYTSQFVFMFECLKSVSDKIWSAVTTKKELENEKTN